MAANRDPVTGRFLRGNSSGGRKQIPGEVKEILQAATIPACKLLCDTIKDNNTRLELRIKCAEIVMERVYGKPTQAIDATLEASVLPAPLSLTQRKEILDRLNALNALASDNG